MLQQQEGALSVRRMAVPAGRWWRGALQRKSGRDPAVMRRIQSCCLRAALRASGLRMTGASLFCRVSEHCNGLFRFHARPEWSPSTTIR